jgi:DhnA family fructose-bisphosphate aldolase class Ia
VTGSKTRRLGHIFRQDGKTLIVAMDHALFSGLVEGLEKPGELIQEVRKGGADAILTTFGVSQRFAEEIGSMGLILRVDGGSTSLAQEPGPLNLVYSVRDALRLGADAVGSMGMPGSQFEAQTLPYLSRLVSECAEWNVPVMAEMLPGGFENPAEMWTAENIGHACRIGAEMGVDFIKTTYSGEINSFRKIVEQVYVPIVVLGGSKSSDPQHLLQVIFDAMQAGASGVAVGRNICCYCEPAKITAAIAAIIHQDATVDEAVQVLHG